MNSIAELYTLELIINGGSYEVGPSDLDLSLSDSIYSIYPRATLLLKDISGIFLESRLTTLGLDYIFKIGFNNKIITLPFIVNSYETEKQMPKKHLNGSIHIELIHEFFTKFKQEYNSFDSSPSVIVEDIVKNEKFYRMFIEKTATIQDDPYYNYGLPFKGFIDKVLIPNSFSVENSYDPYYCFIDAENSFHYETYSKMLSRKSSRTLYFKPDRKIQAVDRIMEFLPFGLKYEKMRDAINQEFFIMMDKANPQFESEEIHMQDNKKSPLPVMEFPNYPYFSKEVSEGFGTQKKDYQSRIRMNLNKKNNNLVDRIYVSMLLDTSLCAGKVVTLDVEFEQENVSASYSGDYLIEATRHSWNSETLKGYTSMVLSRQSAKYPSGSTISGDLIK